MNNSECIEFLEIKDNLLELVKFCKRHLTGGKSDLIYELEKLSGKKNHEFEWNLKAPLDRLRLIENYFQMIIEIENKRQRALKKQVVVENKGESNE